MSLRDKRVLVTGAGGFIGSHLAEALVRAGARTRALVHYNSRGDIGNIQYVDPDIRQGIEIMASDVRDRTGVRKAVEGCDIVFHLAALVGIPYSYYAPQSYVSINIGGTLNVLEACRDCRVGRLVHPSTSEVYGTAQYTPIDEKHPLHAQSPYAATKIAADQLAYSFFAAFQLPVVVVRPFNTFGPRQSARAVIPTIIAQALDRDEIILGSTEPVRDFLYVTDSALGFMAAAAAPESVCGEVINLGSGRGTSIKHLVERIGAHLGRGLKVIESKDRLRPDRSEVLELICGAAQAKAQLKWQATVSLDEGLGRTIAWIHAHRELYRLDEYAI
jgi:NAD dependent epimerase/dehydratase